MRTFTIEQFFEFAERPDWVHTLTIETLQRYTEYLEREDDSSIYPVEVEMIIGKATITSRLEGIEITYTEGFKHPLTDVGVLQYHPIDGQYEFWTSTGVQVVYPHDDPATGSELSRMLGAKFKSVDYSDYENEVLDRYAHLDSDFNP